VAGGKPDIDLLDLIDERLLHVKTFPQRIGLDRSQGFQDSDVAGFNNHAHAHKDDDQRDGQ
jgi:hypothetical protein